MPTAEGELEIQVPQIRGAAETLVGSVILGEVELLVWSWTRSTCRPGRAVPRRGYWWPGLRGLALTAPEHRQLAQMRADRRAQTVEALTA